MRYYSFIIFGLLLQLTNAEADVRASKGNVYSVVAPPTGVTASKANVYSVLSPPGGVTVSKANIYSVIRPVDGVSVSKAVIYSVLAPPSIKQPNVLIFTKTNNDLDIPQSELKKIVLNATAAN